MELCEAAIRSSCFLSQGTVVVGKDKTFFAMACETHVHPDVMNLTVKPLVNHTYCIQFIYLEHDPLSSPALSHPVFTSYAEYDHYTNIANQTNGFIEQTIKAE